jgi:hypothetical protein
MSTNTTSWARILECPECGRETSSLKYHVFLAQWQEFLVGYRHEWTTIRACPACLRRRVWATARRLLSTAHLTWPFIVLPWALALTACSFVPGHSYQFEHDSDHSFSPQQSAWRLYLAVASAFFLAYLPVLGLVAAILIFRLNRRTTPGAKFLSTLGLTLSLLAHLAVGALVLAEVLC